MMKKLFPSSKPVRMYKVRMNSTQEKSAAFQETDDKKKWYIYSKNISAPLTRFHQSWY